MKRWIVWLVACVLALGVAGTAAYTLTPWPKALLIRHAFEKGGAGGRGDGQTCAARYP